MRSRNAKLRVPVLMQHVGVMYSGSMEPAFYRGDLLFLTNPANQRYQTGDITVYKIPGADIPIVHRVLETHDLAAKDNGCVVCSTCPMPLGVQSLDFLALVICIVGRQAADTVGV